MELNKFYLHFFENNSCVKKLYVPVSVDCLGIEIRLEVSSKTTDNVWAEVVPENPYFYSEKGIITMGLFEFLKKKE